MASSRAEREALERALNALKRNQKREPGTKSDRGNDQLFDLTLAKPEPLGTKFFVRSCLSYYRFKPNARPTQVVPQALDLTDRVLE